MVSGYGPDDSFILRGGTALMSVYKAARDDAMTFLNGCAVGSDGCE
jgi:hypothetical protein